MTRNLFVNDLMSKYGNNKGRMTLRVSLQS